MSHRTNWSKRNMTMEPTLFSGSSLFLPHLESIRSTEEERDNRESSERCKILIVIKSLLSRRV